MSLFDAYVYIPRALWRQLEALAEEIGYLNGKEMDSNALAAGVLKEFIAHHRKASFVQIARTIEGMEPKKVKEEETPIKFFR